MERNINQRLSYATSDSEKSLITLTPIGTYCPGTYWEMRAIRPASEGSRLSPYPRFAMHHLGDDLLVGVLEIQIIASNSQRSDSECATHLFLIDRKYDPLRAPDFFE